MGDIQIQAGDEVLAEMGARSIWIRRGPMDISAAPFQTITHSERAYDYLNAETFMQLLPLLHFLREIVGAKPMPLRACFMFDDPNLHTARYGFADYAELATLAHEHGFHVAFATVPLDGWYVNECAARLFREHPHQLSLLIHGNDHWHSEFGANGDSDLVTRRLAQALQRIAKLEARSGVRVSRVMAPPHGACSSTMLRAMLALGFDGATISPGSLRRWIRDFPWPVDFGLDAAEMIHGFPVVPRFRLSDFCEGEIVIAAFLERPIIPVGHHATLAKGAGIS